MERWRTHFNFYNTRCCHNATLLKYIFGYFYTCSEQKIKLKANYSEKF